MSEHEISMSSLSPESGQRHVAQIKVRGLFGHLNYDVPIVRQGSSQDDLLIVYGENGSGKTTILKLLYNTLSARRGGGRRTYIARTPFESFEVELSGGYTVLVTKDQRQLVGSYTQTIMDNVGVSERFDVTATSDGEVTVDQSVVDMLTRALSELHVCLYFLPDDRRVQADFSDELSDVSPRHRVRLAADHIVPSVLTTEMGRWIVGSRDDPEVTESHHLRIGPVLASLADSLRAQAIQGSNTGEENAGSIYLRVIERLKGVAWSSDGTPVESASALVQRIQSLNSKILQFSRFGLPVGFPGDKLLIAFNEASARDKIAIQGVLEPYLEGLEARLSALQELHDIISTYVETVNYFFSDKILDPNIQGGISVRSQWKKSIDPNLLSSGERQLLLLLSNTILARRKATIFIIDEPELSLNVTWQRQFVSALLRCSHGGGIQYNLASHSLELIPQYKDRTTRLASLRNG